jgi:hypothetical protein
MSDEYYGNSIEIGDIKHVTIGINNASITFAAPIDASTKDMSDLFHLADNAGALLERVLLSTVE